MGVTHTFVSTKPPAADPTQVGSAEWNALHVVALEVSELDPAFLLPPDKGGTGIANAAGSTLTLGGATTISGGGTLALGGFTLTVPATGTAALLATANVFTTTQTINDAVSNERFIFNTLDSSAYNSDIVYKWGNVEKFRFQGLRTGTKYYVGVFHPSGYFPWMMEPLTASMGVNRDISYYGVTAQLEVWEGPTSSMGFRVVNPYAGHYSPDIVQIAVEDSLGFGYTVGTVFSIGSNGKLTSDMLTLTGNTVQEVAHFGIRNKTASTGGANGFGASLGIYAETATDGTYQQQGLISTSWIDATNVSRKAKMSLSAYDTAARLGLEIEASGTEPMLGFYGVAPIARAVLATGAGATVDNVITALQNLGLVKQS